MTYCNGVYDLFNLLSNLNGILTFKLKIYCFTMCIVLIITMHCIYSYMHLEMALSIIHCYLHAGSMHDFSAGVSMPGFHLL